MHEDCARNISPIADVHSRPVGAVTDSRTASRSRFTIRDKHGCSSKFNHSSVTEVHVSLDQAMQKALRSSITLWAKLSLYHTIVSAG